MSCESTCSCGGGCGCGHPQTPGASVPFRMSDVTGALQGVVSTLQWLRGSGPTLAPVELYHVVTTEVVLPDGIPTYFVGDVLSKQQLGTQCFWVNRTRSLVIAPPLAGNITPLEGEGSRKFSTATLTTGNHTIGFTNHGATSVMITCTQAMFISDTVDGLAAAATRIAWPANVTYAVGRYPGEPRIPEFFVSVAAAASLSKAWTE